MLLRQRLQGYTLIYAIIVVIIVTSFALLFLSYFQINYALTNRIENKILGRSYCYDGLAILNKYNLYDQPYSLSVQDGYNLTVIKKKWGAYDLYYSYVINNRNDSLYAKIAFAGYGRDSTDHTILFLRNSNSPLNIADSVLLEGDCYIPSGYIKFTTSTHFVPLLPDQIHSSPDTLVRLSGINEITDWARKIVVSKEKKITIDDSIYKSFATEQIVISADTIIIYGQLKGNIIITGKIIKVQPAARLEDIILIADDIIFPDRFCGRLQAIAAHKIEAGSNNTFNYPTVLLLLPELNEQLLADDYYITTGDSVNISGEVYANTERYDLAIKTSINMHRNARVTGIIYSSGMLSFKGICKGTIFCEKLMNYDAQNIKPNLIRNTQIFPGPPFFSGSKLFPLQGAQKIIKWLK